MPREVKAYGCSYRCGHKVQTHKDRIALHEQTCFLNPAVRACKSCKHNLKDWDEIPNGCYGGATHFTTVESYYCDIEKLPEGTKATKDCQFWEQK